MSKFFNNLIFFGIFVFALGMLIITFYQANNPLEDYINLGKVVRNIGIGVIVIGVIEKIFKKTSKIPINL